VNKGDKIAFVSRNTLALNTFFKILWGEAKPHTGEYTWGVTVTMGYLPNENEKFFTEKQNLVDWLRQYSEEKDETYIRGFLGKIIWPSARSTSQSINCRHMDKNAYMA
jgi:ATPase subunit of ABC transporter with duplicated ATPase domains